MASALMDQYRRIKARHPGEILLFHLGDFYEMFYEDAREAAQILKITLTSRQKGEERIPMAGFPVHAAGSYIRRLLAAGKRVAICDQIEDPQEAKGDVVERAVVRVVTPGTLTEEEALEAAEPNYLAAVCVRGARAGIAWLDLSTGRFVVHETEAARLADELARIAPREVLVPEGARVPFDGPVTERPDWTFEFETARESLLTQLGTSTLDGFGCGDLVEGVSAAGALLAYLGETHRAPLAHVTRLERQATVGVMTLDRATRAALELVRGSSGERAGSLLWALDRTRTAMGARLLRERLEQPSADLGEIRARHDAVEDWVLNDALRREVQEALRGMGDLERVLGRVGSNRATPRDLAILRAGLARLPAFRSALARSRAARLRGLDVGEHADLRALLERALVDDPRDEEFIRPGFDADLDRWRATAGGGREEIARIEAREAQRTGIPSLRVGYNRVFGYYIEVTNAHRDRVPPDYQRVQTLKGAERYTTPELREFESRVVRAEEEARRREREVFERLRAEVARHIPALQRTIAAVAEADVTASLAEVAVEWRYVRPVMTDEIVLEVRDGRHPVLERILRERFVPNDVRLDGAERMRLITGPNMGGKSVYIRQCALIVLMAQSGSFVPAAEARIGVADRVFVRSGASDEIARGQSTFMVEMVETAHILNYATERSVVVLDEIGRGTSTYDGVALARAVGEYLHDRVGARTLFATHYHELTDLARACPRARNYHAAVREWRGEVVFLYRIEPGPTDRSYGVHVAKLAGVPREVVERARRILRDLERGRAAREPGQAWLFDAPAEAAAGAAQAGDGARALCEELAAVDPERLPPIEALRVLAEFVSRARALRD